MIAWLRVNWLRTPDADWEKRKPAATTAAVADAVAAAARVKQLLKMHRTGSQRPMKDACNDILYIMFVYYSCSHNATTEPTSVTQDSTDTIERKASIYNQT